MAVLISINQKGRVGKFLSSNRGMVHMGDDYLNDHSCEHFIREIKQHIHNFFD